MGWTTRLLGIFGILAAAIAGTIVWVPGAGAADTDIVLSEIMYHPPDEIGVEFLELANRGDTPVDVSGWCFTDGFTFCFPAGSTIASGARVLLTESLAAFPGAYPGAPTPVGEYDGGISNGGETLTLVDEAGTVIDTVTYTDEAPWPGAADGNGPSLELIDLDANNDSASAWAASADPSGHTAGQVNSVEGTNPGSLTDVGATPFRPNAGQPIVISARIENGVSATATQRIDWNTPVTVPMDDGPDSVGGAGDGVWSATIAGQSSGTLVRYRVDATIAGGGSASQPAIGDTIEYFGVVVDDPANTDLPLIEWFMDDDVYDDLLANHRFDDTEGDAVMSFDGIVYDGVRMRIRGASSRSNRKVNWKVEFPDGYLFDMPGILDYPVDEFNLQSDRFPVAQLGWETAETAGLPTVEYTKVRTHRNGDFWSVGTLSESYDGTWRDENGYDDWAMYKAEQNRGRTRSSPAALEASGDWDKKERDDEGFDDLWAMTEALDAPSTPAQEAWIWENMNVPEIINYAAVVGVLRHSDSSWKNYYVARDTEGTGRWEMLLWDLDLLWRTDVDDEDGDFLTPAANGQKFMEAVMSHDTFRTMYFRRLRTLSDELLAPTFYEDRYDEIASDYLADAELDRQAWGGLRVADKKSRMVSGINDRRAVFAANQGANAIPPAATGATPIVINEIDYDPAVGGDGEFLELHNTSTTEAIDLSGWTLSDGIDMTIPGGTVLLPGAFGLVVKDDPTFRSVHGPTRFVIGEYDGKLGNEGETVILRTASGQLVDSLTWSNAAPWPTGPAGNGPSLERLDPSGSTGDPGNWMASETSGGSPGETNGDAPPPPPPPPPPSGDVVFVSAESDWRYLTNATPPPGWTSPGFADAGWDVGNAELGYGDGDIATTIDPAGLTAWFRRSFVVADASDVVSLEIGLEADDGAVVHLNGVEVVRDNMPDGTITPTTPALSTRSGSGEDAVRTFAVPAAVLNDGTNVIAVQVHNRSTGSSDLAFDLSLTGEVADGGDGPGELISAGSTWRYLDTGVAPPASWRSITFTDGPWRLGTAELGYGDGDESTIVDRNGITVWARQSFELVDPNAVGALTIRVLADDGAVVYLNGTEVVRDNMPDGTITPTTRASSIRHSADERAFRSFAVAPSLLVDGTNVIAVEVHNHSNGSSDLSFDLSVQAN